MVESALIKSRWAWSPETGFRENVAIGLQGDFFAEYIEGVSEVENQLILPGFINLHAHLELSALKGQLDPGQPFSQWVGQLRGYLQTWELSDYLNSMNQGQIELLRSGTTAVLDLGNTDANLLCEPILRLWSAREVMGFDSTLADVRFETGLLALAKGNQHPWRKQFLAPHAPYSTSGALLQKLLDQEPWTIHLDESEEERLFFEEGRGGLADLAHLLAPTESWPIGQGLGLDWMLQRGMIPGTAILVHMNLADERALSKIKDRDCTLVHCPQSRAFFGHQQPDLDLWKTMGFNIALGTDSLASNSNLNLWSELSSLSGVNWNMDQKLRMVTQNPARALGISDELAELKTGFRADWQIIELPEDCDRPWEYLSTQHILPSEVGIDGLVRHQSDK